MSAFQVCARCATRWPVGTRPAVWCPRCHGVLLSPVSAQAPATGTRNFRWVAKKPRNKTSRPAGPSHPRRTATPKYDEIPRWGLIDQPVSNVQEREPRLRRWAGAAPGLLVLAASLLGLAAAAELFRYGILLYNRTRLVGQMTLVTSDALVLFAETASIVIGIAAAVGSACWLVDRRRIFFERAGTRDPRSSRTIFVGTLVPVLSLALPGVFLTELADAKAGVGKPRLVRDIRIWWGLWVLNWALVVAASLWRLRDSLQAQADGVLLSAIVALVGVLTALWTVHLLHSIDDLGWRGTHKPSPTRWVVSVPRETVADVPLPDRTNRSVTQGDRTSRSVTETEKAAAS